MYSSLAFLAAFCRWQTVFANDILLVPITNVAAVGLGIRDASPRVTLQNQESLLWGQNANGSSFVVNVTVATGQDEMVVSMDGFSQALKTVSCDGDLSLTFANNAAYKEAIREWNWVNGGGNRSLIMVVNYPGCGQAEARQPWTISAAKYTDTTSTIDFTATMQSWSDMENSLKIEWGPSTGSALSKRDSPHVVSLASSFPSKLYTYSNNATGLDFTLGCDKCGSSGNLDFSGSYSGLPWDASLTVSAIPSDVTFDLDLTLRVSGDLVKPYSDTETFLTIPIDGFEVADLINIGPSLDFSVGYAFSGLQGSAKIGKSITASISNSAIAQIDLLDLSSKKNKFTGWEPTFTIGDWDLDAQIDVALELYAQMSLEFTVKVLKFGAGVGLNLKIPDVNLALNAEYNSKGGVCPGTTDDFGVKFSGDVAVDLNFDAFLDSHTTNINLLSATITTLPSFCTGFGAGPTGGLSISGYTSAISTSTSTTATSKTAQISTASSKTTQAVPTASAIATYTSKNTGTGATITNPLTTPSTNTACSIITNTIVGGSTTKNCFCGNAVGPIATMTGPKGVVYERCAMNGTFNSGGTSVAYSTQSASVTAVSLAPTVTKY